MNNTFLHNFIINCAKEVGFDICGVVKAEQTPSGEAAVEKWIEEGHNGTMSWFEHNKEARYNPKLLTESRCEKSLIVCGISYQLLESKKDNIISKYAHFRDYHITLKELLAELHSKIEERLGHKVEARAYVDSAPLLERHWGQRAGLGWIGRNSMLINRELGSMFFIASLLIDIELDHYSVADSFEGCGNCRRCIDSCKSGAILGNRSVAAEKCLSYITIEHKLPFLEEQKELIRSWNSSIFGCDRCQDVCPWNIRAAKQTTTETDNHRREILEYKQPIERIEQIETAEIPKSSPLRRAGRKRLTAISKILEKEHDLEQ